MIFNLSHIIESLITEETDDLDDNDKFVPPNSTEGQLYKCHDKYVSIQQYYHYAHRGSLLRHLTFFEYPNIIQIVPIKTRKISRNTKDT